MLVAKLPTGVERFKESAAYALYMLLGSSADFLHATLQLVHIIPRSRPSSDYRALCGIELNAENISVLSPDTVVKWHDWYEPEELPLAEAMTLDHIFTHTTIPVPRVRRVIRIDSEHTDAIILDRIPGRQLRRAWPTMSLWAKLRVAFILRGYIRQLHTVRNPRPGMPGPMAPGDLARFFNCRRRANMIYYPHLFAGVPEEWFDCSQPLVMTHCDLNMRNILVGDDGRLYLLDWGYSGFYPPWFEYVNWEFWLCCEMGGKAAELDREDRLWNLMIPFITGPYYKEDRWFSFAYLTYW
ncbi:kinase-like domain-containing protein [Epithele typhae]|uniref:kinase-like domain-containing protein n=1 Tax=Epithele typhae TaxID=378194 RepID=UPI002007BBA9|nr:kinase-like domain-containing protein [Epithele typhae]KAH9912623.1 kinase-like domain-containing protein [Epithele typhae]